MREFIRSELSGWKKTEVFWLLSACAVIWGLSIYWQDTAMGIISSVTGVACVVLTGKGKLSAYLFGLVNSVLYAIISFQAALYGETLLNALYYVPMQFIGFALWNRNMNSETAEVKKRRMKTGTWLVTIAAIGAVTFAFGLFLRHVGDAMPFVDAFTTVCSVAAMLISVLMYAEQWWIWVAVDIVSVYMWWRNFSVGNDNAATLLMWVVYLLNAVIMLIRWEKEARRNHEV
ncbi:MAG: nicotinamide mononucleotide transporter [Clostridia bacterium]|nr:nicotinamide mononucleotide transporter [Clostridia bacterium]